MSNFWTRAITGTLFVIVMVLGIWWSYWSLCVLFFVIAMLGLNEFYVLLQKADIHPQRWVGLAVGALFFFTIGIAYSLSGISIISFATMFPYIAIVFFIELYRNKQNPFQNIALTMLGIVYIIIPFALWVLYFNHLPVTVFNSLFPAYSPHILLGYFFILWTNDTGAYIVGITIGKHKLWERISPKKTWEGFFGGMILSIGIAYIIALYFHEISALLWMLIAVTITVFGTMGGMVSSMFKRSINVKDSGSILPGHGGILDRFDGVLLSTPFVLALIWIAQAIHDF